MSAEKRALLLKTLRGQSADKTHLTRSLLTTCSATTVATRNATPQPKRAHAGPFDTIGTALRRRYPFFWAFVKRYTFLIDSKMALLGGNELI